jgi:hypothetical protein
MEMNVDKLLSCLKIENHIKNLIGNKLIFINIDGDDIYKINIKIYYFIENPFKLFRDKDIDRAINHLMDYSFIDSPSYYFSADYKTESDFIKKYEHLLNLKKEFLSNNICNLNCIKCSFMFNNKLTPLDSIYSLVESLITYI